MEAVLQSGAKTVQLSKNETVLNISQGSVATRLQCDWVFNDDFIANLPLTLIVKMKISQYLAKSPATG